VKCENIRAEVRLGPWTFNVTPVVLIPHHLNQSPLVWNCRQEEKSSTGGARGAQLGERPAASAPLKAVGQRSPPQTHSRPCCGLDLCQRQNDLLLRVLVECFRWHL